MKEFYWSMIRNDILQKYQYFKCVTRQLSLYSVDDRLMEKYV